MQSPYDQLISQLQTLPNITVGRWKETQLWCVFLDGKEIAHFHQTAEIDLRLTPKIIKERELAPPPDSTTHPNRSPKSRWLVQTITIDNLDQLVELVKIAASLR